MSGLESLASVVPSQCLEGKLQSLSLSNVSKQVVMGLKVVFLWQAQYFYATFSEDALHFFLASSTLDTSDLILRGRRNTLDVSCCVLSANRIVSAARSGDKVQIPWQERHFVTCDEK